ncbi:MAG: ATP-binding protein [Lachnospiraceae bacterium]|nr:ATP-binding protein [Lachnospiraceae bacterium]
MAEYVLDLMECLVKAGLLLFLCKDNIILKEKYRSTGKILFFLQAVVISYWISHSAWVDRVIYRDAEGAVNNSAYSVVKLAVVVCCSFIAMDILYVGRRLAKLYLLLVFYMVLEMARLAFYSGWSLVIMGYMEHLTRQIMSKKIEPEHFMELTANLQIYSFVFFAVGCSTLIYIVLRCYRRYMNGTVEEISRQGIWFLMLTPIVGMSFDVAWRIIFYRQQGTEIDFLYERHGSMYLVVPVTAVLCLMCTIFSRKIYSELMEAEEQKSNLLFYKQQLSDMTAHVKDMEQLYDGVRGMRHDINNYVADMEQLLQMSTESGQLSEDVRKEAGQYLRSMQQAASELFLQFSTGNPVTDVILNRKGLVCAQEQITLEGDLIYPVQLAIEAFDIGILLNNALDNAIEACRRVAEGQKRFIRFRGYVKGRMFFLVVENSCDEKSVRSEHGRLRTTKPDADAHGLGMNNMRSCVEKYYGTMQYEVKENCFVLTLMMQGNERL